MIQVYHKFSRLGRRPGDPDWRELALAKRSTANQEEWSNSAEKLPSLTTGQRVMLQNLSGNHPNCWDKRGVVKKALPFDQYEILFDGSRRLTLRNRKHIRRFRSLSHQNPLPDLSTVAPTANCSYRHDSRWLLTIDDGRSSSRVIAPGRNANRHSRCTDTPDRQKCDWN